MLRFVVLDAIAAPAGSVAHKLFAAALEGLTLGVGSARAGIRDHGLDLRHDERGRSAEVVLWTHDVDAAFALAMRHGARVLQEPHDVRGLRIAYVLDPDGNPVEFVQHRDPSEAPPPRGSE